MSSTEITRSAPDPIGQLLEQPYYNQLDAQSLALISTKMKGLSAPEIGVALEMARSMNLNPWNGEFYATKSDNGQILLMVGRDGLLRKAEEFPDYRGYDSGIVYEGDVFERGEPDAGAMTLRGRAGVKHTQGVPLPGAKILGAWAVAERAGRPPRFFFARLEEYLPTNPKKLQYSPWGSATSIMIEKVAISVVHRTLTNLSGVYLPEEVERATERQQEIAALPSAEEELAAITEIVTGLDAPAETREKLLDAITRLNAVSPHSWGPGRAQMTLPGRGEEELARTIAEIEMDIADAVTRRPVAEEVPEATVVEATVVDERPVEELDLEACEARVEVYRDRLAAAEESGGADLEAEQMLERLSARIDELQPSEPEA